MSMSLVSWNSHSPEMKSDTLCTTTGPCHVIFAFIRTCVYNVKVSSFIAIYAIISYTTITISGHNTGHKFVPTPKFGRHLLLNLSLSSLGLWEDHPTMLSRMGNSVDFVHFDKTHHIRKQRDLSGYQKNLRFGRVPSNDIQTNSIAFNAQMYSGFSDGKERNDKTFPLGKSWSNNDVQKENDDGNTDSTAQTYTALSPVVVEAYRADNPCLQFETHWVRSDDDCSIFFVCARHRVAAVMSCPRKYAWSNRVTNCVPQNSRWDDCSTASKNAVSKRRRRKLLLRRQKYFENDPVTRVTITTGPTPALTTARHKGQFRMGSARRHFPRRKLRMRNTDFDNSLNRNEEDMNSEKSVGKTSDLGLLAIPGKAAKSSSQPSLQNEPQKKENARFPYISKHQQRSQSRRGHFKEHMRRFRFRHKDNNNIAKTKWFITSSGQEQTPVPTNIQPEVPDHKNHILKRKRFRKGYRKRKRNRQSDREPLDLKQHTLPIQTKDVTYSPEPEYPTTDTDNAIDYNNIPTRWWRDSDTVKPTTSSITPTTEPTSVDNDENMVDVSSEKQVKKGSFTLAQNSTLQNFVPECGVSSTSLIVGGLPVSHERWPWVVSLQLSWASRHVCGGTLVHPQWLITAAHCVAEPDFSRADDWRVVFGDHDPVVEVDLILKHPDFVNGDNYPNDIAMLRLSRPTDVTGFNIRHACLPSNDWSRTEWQKCWIMGWGEAKETFKSELKELEVDIWKNTECSARWGWKRILNSHVCVGNGDSGACNGDSGGPLICRRDGYNFLTGVTSWGVSGCQTTGYPGVFTKVAYYRKWIRDVINDHTTNET